MNYQNTEMKNLKQIDNKIVETRISKSETLLKDLGYSLETLPKVHNSFFSRVMVVPTWNELYKRAESLDVSDDLESLFTKEELATNELAIKLLNKDFNAVYKLDELDVALSVSAGMLASIIDIILIGIPQKTPTGLKSGALSNYVRDWFDKKFPEKEMEKLANLKISKVPFDAQDNRYTKEYVGGLSAYYHRLLSLGHDPLLGLVFGVIDIVTGRMTTIDKTGKIVSQVMENYSDRKERDIFSAIAKQILHFKSDITTSMGLPAPLMALFNLFQFGSVGEEEQTIAEIVQNMYYEGYDFIHFCSMTISSMIIEVIIRLGYAMKRMNEGYSIVESIPISLNRTKNPKLSTMLFMGHSIASAVNAGKVCFMKNPMAINYSQWIVFTKHSYKQLKWSMFEKPELRDLYVREKITEDLRTVYNQLDSTFADFSGEYKVVFK